MYFDFTVRIPVIPGKITIKKKGDSSYVLYEYERTYDSNKQFNVPRRAIIGKVCSDDSRMMSPNEKFQEFFPDFVLPEEHPSSNRSCCLRIGSYIVIESVLNEYCLATMLKKWIENDAGLLLDFVAYLLVDEENAGQYYPDFAFCHPLFSDGMKIFTDSKVSRFLASITTDMTIGFLNDWNAKRDHRQRVYISYDSTNKNSQAGDVDLVEFGKAKDDRGLPIFNLAIAFDKTNRIPLFYEEYPGSINDMSQFEFMVDKVVEYGYKKIGFILDRGYFSKNNIQYIDANDYEFIIMVKGCKTLVSQLVLACRNTFENARDCAIRQFRTYGTTVKHKLYEDDRTERYFHLYFSPGLMASEREQLELKIDKFKAFIKKQEGTSMLFGNTYQEYFTFHYNKEGELLFAEERKDVIERQLSLCGYFSIITSEKMNAEEALVLYKGRDISEKLFSSDKSFIGSKSMRTQTESSLSAKIFIEFIALIVRNRIYNLLREEMLKLEKKPNFMTVPAAIRELEKIEMVRRNNGLYRLDHAVTRTQKTILSSFGIDEDDVRKKATEIGKKISSGQSLLDSNNDDKEEETDNGEDQDDWLN
ncbi:MAG: transposase [Sphaerochaetaceae bacterium]